MATPLSALSLIAWLALAGAAPGGSSMSLGAGPGGQVRSGMSERPGPLLALAPARGGKAKASAPEPAPAPIPPAYGPEQARADIELVLTGRGQDYLQARARLEQHPTVAAPLVTARMTATPAPTAVEQRRLLALLGGIARPEDVPLFADAMRRDVAAAAKQSQEQGIELPAAEPWREILRAQGPAAAPALTGLVAEKSFSEELRGLLLADLVAVTPADKLPELVALVGLGAPSLRAALRQAIARRAHASAGERAQLVQVVDAAIEAREPARLPGLVLLRAAIGGRDDGVFTQRAAALAEDAAAEFAARVAALRVLVARRSDPAAQTVLARLAEQHLPADKRVELRSEILGSLALAGLEPGPAAAVVDRLQLTGADAPRVAVAAFAVATLPADGAWLDVSQRHAWPEVRAAALARVDGPCSAGLLRRLRDGTSTSGNTFETDATVAREVIAALGRCGGPDAFAALQAVVVDADQNVDRRAEAARQLVDRHGSAGADVVAAVLRSTDDLAVALRLVRALQRYADDKAAPSDDVRAALCAASKREELATSAQRAVRGLFPDLDDPCASN
ncbi:HEAT repeat domain-containing protein [Nannocystis radixulma]|uniref:HEAT repeat domain-containing protein n=1 Tax=Nannocystis radixulma TaxID=2995305 RepID=A0ABT5BIV7_9BACT|nr:HEAT repeat domain-containing protein [Nannocystis radixulma]MDC0674090.1 HEAT repeat domain-containing protein [Nannocystis radixulma]